jgi:hypothetical protein
MAVIDEGTQRVAGHVLDDAHGEKESNAAAAMTPLLALTMESMKPPWRPRRRPLGHRRRLCIRRSRCSYYSRRGRTRSRDKPALISPC